MNERLSSENSGESKQHIPEKKNEVHRVEMFLGELLAARYGAEMELVLSPPRTECLSGWLVIWCGWQWVGWFVGWFVVVLVFIPECLEYK